MGFTAARATQRMIAVRDEKKLPTFIELESLLNQQPADRQKWLKERSIKLTAKQAKGVKDAIDIPALVEAFGNLVDLRASPDASPIGDGAPYLQPTEERRRSGSHYTPRSLTEPIVRHALEPAFERLGPNASPEAVLSLKVCDPACGSGAFLVEACRQLGARLEQAWNMHGAEKPVIPPDEDEALHARRLVAQRCVYGVDRNPMAVDLARLSLWLAPLARDHEFTFLDHAIKSGDSLVGLTRREIEAANWDAEANSIPLYGKIIREAVDRALQGREAIRTAPDDVIRAIQAARHKRVESEVDPARIVGDAVIAAFFAGDKPRAREIERVSVEQLISGQTEPKWDKLRSMAAAFRAEHGWQPFHWEIEFPEVFGRENPGFDAMVGNPPFKGGASISTEIGVSYFSYLQSKIVSAGDKTDLVLYFVSRAWQLLRSGGAAGLIGTKTVAQGDSRSTLRILKQNQFHLFRAVRRLRWPGEAHVIVSILHLAKDVDRWPKFLEGKKVDELSVYLRANDVNHDPEALQANRHKIFEGFGPYGDGFLVERGSALLRELVDAGEGAIVFPYIGGEDVMDSPDHSSSRMAIYAGKITLEEFRDRYPIACALVEATVRPERRKKSKRVASMPWWQFLWPRPELRMRMEKLSNVFVRPRVAKQHAFARVPAASIVSNSANVLCDERMAPFAVLQSRIHEIWARFFSSSMKDDLRYAPSDCFETFPFPPGYESDRVLEAVGQAYHDHRAQLMSDAHEGMTKTYNRFHKPSERGAAIQTLRALHDEMDRAVLRAYGWHDLADEVKPELLAEETEDDHTYQGRYFWNAEGRDRVLARLLALNAVRHADEVAAGKAPTGRTSSTSQDEGDDLGDDSDEDGQEGLLL
jgi:hypothetical protein